MVTDEEIDAAIEAMRTRTTDDGHIATITTLRNWQRKLATVLEEAEQHLDYCGYGDKWERECAEASKLSERIAAARKNEPLPEPEPPKPEPRRARKVRGAKQAAR